MAWTACLAVTWVTLVAAGARNCQVDDATSLLQVGSTLALKARTKVHATQMVQKEVAAAKASKAMEDSSKFGRPRRKRGRFRRRGKRGRHGKKNIFRTPEFDRFFRALAEASTGQYLPGATHDKLSDENNNWQLESSTAARDLRINASYAEENGHKTQAVELRRQACLLDGYQNYVTSGYSHHQICITYYDCIVGPAKVGWWMDSDKRTAIVSTAKDEWALAHPQPAHPKDWKKYWKKKAVKIRGFWRKKFRKGRSRLNSRSRSRRSRSRLLKRLRRWKKWGKHTHNKRGNRIITTSRLPWYFQGPLGQFFGPLTPQPAPRKPTTTTSHPWFIAQTTTAKYPKAPWYCNTTFAPRIESYYPPSVTSRTYANAYPTIPVTPGSVMVPPVWPPPRHVGVAKDGVDTSRQGRHGRHGRRGRSGRRGRRGISGMMRRMSRRRKRRWR